MLKGRDILLYLSHKYKGNWEEMYQAIKRKEKMEEEDVSKVLDSLGCEFITLIDEQYPEGLKNTFKPPFVLYYKGNLELLKNDSLYVNGNGKIVKNIKDLLKDIIPDHPIITTLDSDTQREAIRIANENNQSCIIVLNGTINQADKDDILSNIDLTKNLIISESAWGTEPDDENLKMKGRICSGLCKNILITSSNGNNDNLKLSIAYSLQNGKDVFVVPEPAMINSFNNELIKQGANLIDRKEDLIA